MSKKILFFCFVLFCIKGHSQVGIGTTTPGAGAMLDITSTTGGVLIPRMTQLQRDVILTPSTGLLIYQNDATPGFYYYNGTAWTPFGASGWALTGNAATNPATNFIGTTDGQDFVIKTNGTEAMRVKNGGNVGIGTNNPSVKLHVEGTTTVGNPGGVSNLINQNFSSYTVVQTHTPDADCTTTNGWTTSSAAPVNYVCASCVAPYLYIDSDDTNCTQAATAYLNFTPTTTSVTISFGYRYYDYASTGTDYFRAFLYNNATTTQVGGDLVNVTTDTNTTYSNTFTVTAGVSYSIRFQYGGTYGFGATVDNVVVSEPTAPTTGSYTFRLQDGTQGLGKVLVSDANGNAYWGSATSGTDNQTLSLSGSNLSISNGNTVTLPSGSGSYTFQNGLTDAGGVVKLGGVLTETTSIGATAFDLNVSSASRTNMLQVDYDENLVKFGHDTLPFDDGVTRTIDGNSTTVDYMTSAYNGNSRGTAVGVGSIEYFVDGEAVIGASDSILPVFTGLNLGTANNRWSTLYCTNTVNVSDAGLKKNISPIGYGLRDLMQLKPVSYKWKENRMGDTVIPENLQETKLGFLAQDLLAVLPEVVKTHDWKITDESRPKEFQYVPNEVLGVMYTDIVPVVVKAVQEQQVQIEELKKTVEELKKQNELLLQLLNKK